MLTAMTSVRVVIVDYNGRDVLPACLTSLATTVAPGIPLTVIDNASPAPSGESVPDNFRNRIEIIRSEKNEGYAGAIFRAWTIGNEKYLIIANNDIEFTPGWLDALVDTAENSGAYAVSAVIEHENESDLEKSTNASLNPLLYLIPGIFTDRTKAVYPSGACFLLRRDRNLKSPPVDPYYFLYFEDVYIGFLLRALGKAVVQCPDAKVRHVGRHSVSKSNPNFVAFLQERNRLLTQGLFFDCPAFFLMAPMFLLDSLFKPLECIYRKKPFWATASAHWWFLFNWIAIWKKHIALRKLPDFRAARIFPFMTSKVLPDGFPMARTVNAVSKLWFKLIGFAVDREASG